MSLVSVVVVNYNGAEYVEQCLNSLLNTNYPNFEIIFVDNCSTDESLEFAEKISEIDSRIRVIRNTKNEGIANGNNIGVKNANGDFIVFLNPDTKVDSNWLNELISAMLSDPDIGVAQSKLILLYENNLIDCVGGFIDVFGWSWKKGFGENDKGQYDEPREIFYATGAAYGIKKELYKKIGMLDPKYFIYYDDVDLCWRIWLSGRKVVYIPKSIVYHASGGITKKFPFPSMIYLLRKNQIAMLVKNYNGSNLLKRLPIALFFMFVASTFYLSRNELKRALSYPKAILWNLLNFRSIWKDRLRVQRSIRKKTDEEIVEKFFIRKPLFLGYYRDLIMRTQ